MDEYVFTLIHGTGAKDADWVKSESQLSRYLTENIKNKVFINSFQWSGKNNLKARDRASVELTAHIKKVCQEHPGAHYYLIAHSHGGNVALYAAKDQFVCDNVKALFCLGTPFIIAEPRKMEQVLYYLRWIGALLVGLLFSMLGFMIWEFISGSFNLLVVALASMAGVGGACMAYEHLSPNNSVHQWIKKIQASMQEEMSYPASDTKMKVISITVEKDEAEKYLKYTNYFGEVVMHFWKKKYFWITFVIYIFTVLYLEKSTVKSIISGTYTNSYFGSTIEAVTFLLSFAIGSGLLFCTSLVVIYQLFFILWSKFLKGNRLSYGSTNLLTNWLIIVRATKECPIVGSNNLDSINAPGEGLHHSRIYSARETFESIKGSIENISSKDF